MWVQEALLLCLFAACVAGHGGNHTNLRDNGGNGVPRAPGGEEVKVPLKQEKLQEGYVFLWDEDSVETYEFNDDLQSVKCYDDATCEDSLLNLELALEQDSTIPSAPYCRKTNNSSGRCTCGEGQCVSYSRDSHLNKVYYYCGPCGWVGARCVESNCSHPQAECRNNYCECIQDGFFYDLSYCYYPYYGKTVMIEMLVSTTVVLAMCALLAFVYSKLGRHRNNDGDFSTLRWRRNSGTRESPSSDTPPTYDDVVDKLPSYQDAVKMNPEDADSAGITNLAFEMECPPPPPPYEEIEKKIDCREITEKVDNVESGAMAAAAKPICEADSSPDSQSEQKEIQIQPIEHPLQNAMQDLEGKTLNQNC